MRGSTDQTRTCRDAIERMNSQRAVDRLQRMINKRITIGAFFVRGSSMASGNRKACPYTHPVSRAPAVAQQPRRRPICASGLSAAADGALGAVVVANAAHAFRRTRVSEPLLHWPRSVDVL